MVTIRVAKQKIGQLVNDLRASGYKPTRAILFGSVAKQRANKNSDVDVAIWDDKFSGCTTIDYEGFLPVLRNYPGYEVHTFHSSETALTNPFIGEIEKSGLEVV